DSLAVDSTVKQWVQLLFGYELIISEEEIRPEGRELFRFIERHQIDVLDCTPSQLRLLLAEGLARSRGSYLALVLVGGEALDETSWSELAVDRASRTYYNVY